MHHKLGWLVDPSLTHCFRTYLNYLNRWPLWLTRERRERDVTAEFPRSVNKVTVYNTFPGKKMFTVLPIVFPRKLSMETMQGVWILEEGDSVVVMGTTVVEKDKDSINQVVDVVGDTRYPTNVLVGKMVADMAVVNGRASPKDVMEDVRVADMAVMNGRASSRDVVEDVRMANEVVMGDRASPRDARQSVRVASMVVMNDGTSLRGVEQDARVVETHGIWGIEPSLVVKEVETQMEDLIMDGKYEVMLGTRISVGEEGKLLNLVPS